MKLNWFSPLAPAATGIAEYTRTVLPSLCSLADVTVWTDQQSWNKELEAFCEIRRFIPSQIDWRRIHRADLSVFNIGNNVEFHGGIWEVNQLHCGLVVLHDLRLQDFFWGAHSRQPGGHEKYIELMEEVYGQDGGEAARQVSSGKEHPSSQCVRYPLTEVATRNAVGMVTHTPNGLDALSERCPQAIAYLPLPYAAADSSQFGKWKSRGRPSAPPFKIVVFGHIGPNRRVGNLFRCLSRIPAKTSFRIEIYGPVWDEEQVRTELARSQVASLVTLHGYTPDLDTAIADADLAINLRFPTMGEASLSQLQIWDHALPSIVTRTGWYASLPEEAVLFVDPDHETENLCGHLMAFAAEPERFRKIGENGRSILQRDHTPGQYAESLLSFAERALSSRATVARMKAARRAGEMLGAWMPGNGSPAKASRGNESLRRVAAAVAQQTVDLGF